MGYSNNEMMEENEKYRSAVSGFTMLMYQKGYRGQYTLLHPGTSHPGMTGMLRACLEKFLLGYDLMEKTKTHFHLTTTAHGNDRIRCEFKLKFDEKQGFRVQEMNVTDGFTNQSRKFHPDANHQIPGAVAVQGLFPKPKPWDNHLKGRFRP